MVSEGAAAYRTLAYCIC